MAFDNNMVIVKDGFDTHPASGALATFNHGYESKPVMNGWEPYPDCLSNLE